VCAVVIGIINIYGRLFGVMRKWNGRGFEIVSTSLRV